MNIYIEVKRCNHAWRAWAKFFGYEELAKSECQTCKSKTNDNNENQSSISENIEI